jgi:hypothetical protein
MKTVFLTSVVVLLGLAAGQMPAGAANLAEMPLAADHEYMAPAARDGDGLPTSLAADVEAPKADAAPAANDATTPRSAADAPAEAAPLPPQPWRLPEPEALKDLGIQQYGWLEQGATFNSLSPRDRWNGPVLCNDRGNEYEMNQLWLGWERKVKTDGCGWDLGGRIDLAYGTDWRYGECYGLETNLDAPNHLYGFVMPQFYLEAGYNDLTVKMGHYAACMGYEIVAAPGNFFYSHSYALGYSEPVLVTGVQADYKLNNAWNVIAGFHDGFNAFQDPNGMFHFLGGAKWHNDAYKVSLSLLTDVGPQFAADDQQYVYSLVFKKQFSEKLQYAFEQVLGGTEEVNNPSVPGGYAKWYGLDQYLIYTLNPCWSAGARAEVFRDQNGTRVAGIGNVNYGWPAAPGFAGTFTEVTLGLNWHPHANFVVRPEARWDCYGGSTNVQGQLPFGDGTRSSQFLFATDLIFSF